MASNSGGFSSSVVMLFATQLGRELDVDERECLEQLSAKGMAKLNRDQCAGIALESTLLELKIAFRRLKQRCSSLAESGFQTQSLPSSPTALGFFRRKFSHYSSHSLTPADVAGLRQAMASNKRRYWSNNEEDFSEDELVDMALELRDKGLRTQAKRAARALSTPVSISYLAPTTISTIPTDDTKAADELLTATTPTSPPCSVELSKFTFPEFQQQRSERELSSPSPTHSRIYQVFDMPGGRHRRITEDPSEAWFEIFTPRDAAQQCPSAKNKDLSPPQSPTQSKSTQSILKSQSDDGVLDQRTSFPSPLPQNGRPRASVTRFGSVRIHEIPAPTSATSPASASPSPLPMASMSLVLGSGPALRAIRSALKRKEEEDEREMTRNQTGKAANFDEVPNAPPKEFPADADAVMTKMKIEVMLNKCIPSAASPSRPARGLAFLRAKLFS